MYVLKHGDRANLYNSLLQDPQISPLVELWKGGFKPIALIGMGLAAVAGFLHYLKVGPNRYEEDRGDKHEPGKSS
jgi:formate dehydrogenase iron-sulfur subunit